VALWSIANGSKLSVRASLNAWTAVRRNGTSSIFCPSLLKTGVGSALTLQMSQASTLILLIQAEPDPQDRSPAIVACPTIAKPD